MAGSLARFTAPLRKRDGDDCWLCEDLIDFSLPPGDPWARSVDHVQPRAAGGQTVMSNLRLAHQWCNIDRGAVWEGVDYNAEGGRLHLARTRHVAEYQDRRWSAARRPAGGLAIGDEPVMSCWPA